MDPTTTPRNEPSGEGMRRLIDMLSSPFRNRLRKGLLMDEEVVTIAEVELVRRQRRRVADDIAMRVQHEQGGKVFGRRRPVEQGAVADVRGDGVDAALSQGLYRALDGKIIDGQVPFDIAFERKHEIG